MWLFYFYFKKWINIISYFYIYKKSVIKSKIIKIVIKNIFLLFYFIFYVGLTTYFTFVIAFFAVPIHICILQFVYCIKILNISIKTIISSSTTFWCARDFHLTPLHSCLHGFSFFYRSSTCRWEWHSFSWIIITTWNNTSFISF